MSARDRAQSATNSLCAYIMCGGGGTRLWPLSRQDNPKQNLQLSGPQTMLGATTRRVAELDLKDVAVSISFMGGVQQHANMETVKQDSLGTFCSMVLEPFGRNTRRSCKSCGKFAAANRVGKPAKYGCMVALIWLQRRLERRRVLCLHEWDSRRIGQNRNQPCESLQSRWYFSILNSYMWQ